MAGGKGVKNLSAGKFGVKGGSGHMAGNTGVGDQKPGQSASSKGGKPASFGSPLKTGGSGKMQKMSPVKTQKSGRSGQS